METKITNDLKSFLKKSEPGNNVQVVIELKPVEIKTRSVNYSRKDKMDDLKKAFDADLQSLATEISGIGGNIIATAWINQTINATIPANGIASIAKLKEVQAIDLPRSISKE